MIVDKPEWLSTPGEIAVCALFSNNTSDPSACSRVSCLRIAGTPIFGVSVHPDGTRLACGGADHKARIYSLLPLLDPQLETAAEAQCPKLLCSLGDHFNPINSVRFSSTGRLATGSDDKLICIYELRGGPGKTLLGSSDGPVVENWRQIHALRGHSNSITDLSWSPEGDFIASSSLDNSVAIWNAQTGRRTKILNGHESFVKGVAWDPVGKYLATLSDDKSVIIWRVEDWTQLEVVRDPFQRWIASTFALRLSWSPEGQFLTVVNCFQSPCHTAAVLQRGNWSSSLTSFVGHKAPVVAACCNPHLFYPPQQKLKLALQANGAKSTNEGNVVAPCTRASADQGVYGMRPHSLRRGKSHGTANFVASLNVHWHRGSSCRGSDHKGQQALTIVLGRDPELETMHLSISHDYLSWKVTC